MDIQLLVRTPNDEIIFSNKYDCKYISYFSDEYVEIIYTQYDIRLVKIYYSGDFFAIKLSNVPSNYIYSDKYNAYMPERINDHNSDIRRYWGYVTPQCYNFSKVDISYYKSNTFKSNQMMKDLFPYIYGFEFETNSGAIPGHDCYDSNLVPLFDGSITGYEYVTTPLNSKHILDSIRNHISLLNKYTTFNKNCSIHIHIGGFPVTIDSVKLLLKHWYKFQNIIQSYLPYYVYNTENFKSSGKSYCQKIGVFNLASFYHKFTGNNLIDDNSLFLDNQYDDQENHKWTVLGRYFNMNIMHLISGKDHKTIEFRFLHPTKSIVELQLWTIILSAFVKYVADCYKSEKFNTIITLDKVLNILPINLKDNIEQKLEILKHLSKLQINRYDFAGINNELKESYFDVTNFNNDLCVD